MTLALSAFSFSFGLTGIILGAGLV